MSDGLALPWGKRPHSDVEESDRLCKVAYIAEGLTAGERIEVEWQITSSDGMENMKWWGAELIERPQQDDASLWKIRYEACDDFETEETLVRFISPEHIERQDACSPDESILQWRKAGAGEDDIIDLHALKAEQDLLEQEMGQSLEQTAMEHLQSSMAPEQQTAVLAGFRTFADHFKSQLQELVQRKDNTENYVVTADDVQNIVAGLKR